jgi:hypothetical protein
MGAAEQPQSPDLFWCNRIHDIAFDLIGYKLVRLIRLALDGADNVILCFGRNIPTGIYLLAI